MAEQLQEALEVERLGQEVHGAELDGLDRVVDRGAAAHQNHLAVEVGCAHGAQHVEPACARHAQIDGGEVVVVLAEFGERLGAVGAQRDVEPGAFAYRPDELANGAVVIDDQQRRAWWEGGATGLES